MFFVRKKDGSLRLIADCRRGNQRCRLPPHCRLASASALSEVRCEKGDSLEFSVHDIANCFFQFAVPTELSQLFGLMPSSASELGVTSLAGQEVSGSTMVYPVLRILPMGMSWAVHWTQVAHRNLIESCPSSTSMLSIPSSCASEIIDGRPPPVEDLKRVVYIDNQL